MCFLSDIPIPIQWWSGIPLHIVVGNFLPILDWSFILLTAVLPKRSANEALGPHCGLFWYLGPHWTQKVGVFPPIDKEYKHMLKNHLKLPYYIRCQYLFVDFHWSQYSLYYVTVGDPFSQFQFFQSLFTERGDLSLKKSAFHIWLVGKRSAFGQKSGGHLVGICLILVKKSFGNTGWSQVSGRCLKGVWREPQRCLESIYWWMSEWYVRCLDVSEG